MFNLMNGNCLEEMKHIPDNLVDYVVIESPYGFNFIGIGLNPDYFEIANKRIKFAYDSLNKNNKYKLS